MSAAAAEFDPSEYHWHVVAKLDSGFAVQLTLDTSAEGKGSGPWGIVVDEPPMSGGTGSGPSPVNLALGALAT